MTGKSENEVKQKLSQFRIVFGSQLKFLYLSRNNEDLNMHSFTLTVFFTEFFSLQVSARQGELGIIPGSMGARSFIVRGKGNPEAFHRFVFFCVCSS